MERRLAAILLTDMVDYSRLIRLDEEGTIARQRVYREEIIDPKISEYGGRIVKTTGDGLLVEFPSVVGAVKCAVEVQTELVRRDTEVPEDQRIRYRIGINLGDIVIDGDDILGDGVNVAARLEGLSEAGGICISGSVHDQLVGKMDVVFEDAGVRTVKHVPRPVRIWHWRPDQTASDQLEPEKPLLLPSKPSIAVLPFNNMSADPEQEYFSDGISEDIITELSRFSELFVIARNSSFTYKGRAVDVRQVGRELGVRYVLEGSVRGYADRVRITAQLIDASNGTHRWAERYDRKLDDVFAVQDELARTIVGILVAHVSKAEAERALTERPATWQAYDCYMRAGAALTGYHSSFDADELRAARRLFRQSMSMDPNYARAYAALATTYVSTFIHPWNDEFLKTATIECGHRLAQKAVQLDPNLPQAHASLGWLLIWKHEHDRSIAEFERAIMLNANVTGWRYGAALVFAGDPARAIDVLLTHMRLDPFFEPYASGFLGFAYYMLGRYEEALPPLRDCAARANNLAANHQWLAATYVQLGEFDRAEAEVAEVLRIEPSYAISETANLVMAFKLSDHRQHLFDALRKAGLPE